MKKIFMPTYSELYKMQDMHVNILPYLYAKAVERLCIEYNNYPRRGSILGGEYKYLREDPTIARGVCSMYPKEIKYSPVAQYDIDLAMKLISEEDSLAIYRLDNLSSFSASISDNIFITREVIRILSEEISKNPKYRFEYKDSKILEDIFMGRIDPKVIPLDSEMIFRLSTIEPYYGLKSKDEELLREGMRLYTERYGIDYECDNKDILTNQTTEVKRLIKCINRK